MTKQTGQPRTIHTAMTLVMGVLVASLALGATWSVPDRHVLGMQDAGDGGEPDAGTPVAGTESYDPLYDDLSRGANDGDEPLDGDPLDGPPADDSGDLPDRAHLEIVRSARPPDEPVTVIAYDGDPRTVWVPRAEAGESWFWLDLGAERQLREVRWLAVGEGAIEIAVSTDRRRWHEVDEIDVGRGWQGIELRDDARYVLLTLLAAEDGELPAIAETAVYGAEEQRSVSSNQRARGQRARDRDRQTRGDRQLDSQQDAAGDASGGREGRRGARSAGRVRVSADVGETRCRGDRTRCQARADQVSVEEDCERDGTCVIDIRADGGAALCDATGGERNVGDGAGRRVGSGGRCEAASDGGAVSVGDVNP